LYHPPKTLERQRRPNIQQAETVYKRYSEWYSSKLYSKSHSKPYRKMRCRVQSKQANLYRLAFLFSAAGNFWAGNFGAGKLLRRETSGAENALRY